MHKILFVLSSNNTKQLEADTASIKDIIKSTSEVVTGPVCFKHQRQLTAYVQYPKTVDKLLRFKSHKSVNVMIKVNDFHSF